ncbi:MAG: MazG nucleotide pyrophosphohydrolase domain-containing protein [Actinomycetota bacterium]|nr:MazG nucleotide pyrophosphohydrolase domain-containing protein [Actinomycetota bacterium]
MRIYEFQDLIREIYFEKDNRRGIDGTFVWFTEEVGELARALRLGDTTKLKEEFADVLAWLVSLASLCDVNLEEMAVNKYSKGCPKCEQKPCTCREF